MGFKPKPWSLQELEEFWLLLADPLQLSWWRGQPENRCLTTTTTSFPKPLLLPARPVQLRTLRVRLHREPQHGQLLAHVPAGAGTSAGTLAGSHVPQHYCCFLPLLQLAPDLPPLCPQLPSSSRSIEATCNQGIGREGKVSPTCHHPFTLLCHLCLYWLGPCSCRLCTWPSPTPCSPVDPLGASGPV